MMEVEKFSPFGKTFTETKCRDFWGQFLGLNILPVKKNILRVYLWSNSRVRQVEGKPAPGAESTQMQIYFQKLLFNFIQKLQLVFNLYSNLVFFICFQIEDAFSSIFGSPFFINIQKMLPHLESEADFSFMSRKRFFKPSVFGILRTWLNYYL